MKDNFLLKKSQQEVFNELSNEEAGKLIKGIFRYANTGDSGLDGYLKIIFIPIKTEIDKNEERYEEVCKKNRENGKLGGRPKKDKEEEENREVIKETEENRVVFEETEENPKNPINHNHTHISPSSITNQNQLSNNNLDDIKQIVDYLNLKTKSKFKYSSKTTQTKIKARLNEGYTLDDFIVVIDKKTDEWLEDSEFSKYLCPETLFGTKFEKYLNQKVIKKNQSQKKDKTMEILEGVYNGTIKID